MKLFLIYQGKYKKCASKQMLNDHDHHLQDNADVDHSGV